MDIEAFVLPGFPLLRRRRIRPGHLFELDPILTVITAALSRRVRARSVLFGRWVGLDEHDI